MNITLIILGIGIGVILLITLIALLIAERKKGNNGDEPLTARLAEYIQRGEPISIGDVLRSLKSRLQGDSTTDAPPPEGKKKKKGRE